MSNNSVGDMSSPKIFTATLEDACRDRDWEGYGMKVEGEWLNIVDDIGLIAKHIEVHEMLSELEENVKWD